MVVRPYFFIQMYRLDKTVKTRENFETLKHGREIEMTMPADKYWICLNIAHLDSKDPLPQHQLIPCENYEASSYYVKFKHMVETKFRIIFNKKDGFAEPEVQHPFVNPRSDDSLAVWVDFEVKEGINEHFIFIEELRLEVSKDQNSPSTDLTLSNVNVCFKVNGHGGT